MSRDIYEKHPYPLCHLVTMFQPVPNVSRIIWMAPKDVWLRKKKAADSSNEDAMLEKETDKKDLWKRNACLFDIRLYLPPLGQVRPFLKTCGM